MDHKELHHQHHQKEREHQKKLQAEHEREMERKQRVIHPVWFFAAGVVLVVVAILIWTAL
jgi:type VI protein secretion system component VasF